MCCFSENGNTESKAGTGTTWNGIYAGELNLKHFLNRAQDSGDWQKDTISKEEFMQLLEQKIKDVKIEQVKEDVRRFIADDTSMDIWSEQYFLDLIKMIRIN